MTSSNLRPYIYSSEEGLVVKFYPTMKPKKDGHVFTATFDVAVDRWQSSCVKTVKVHPEHTGVLWLAMKKIYNLNKKFKETGLVKFSQEGVYFKTIEVKKVAISENEFSSIVQFVEYAFLSDNKSGENQDDNLWKEKLQKCYTEIWQNMLYPISMKGKPKADDILKREFPFLKI